MSDSENLEPLKIFGTKYFKEELFKPKPVEIQAVRYGKNHLQIGRKLDGTIFYLDLTEALRLLLIGSTRSGKTFVLRGLADRLNKIGKDIIFLNDPKNEFFSSIDPVQPKFQSGLLEGETPTGMNVVTLRPTFFKTCSPQKHRSNFWYSVDMRQLTKSDFLTMMNANEMTMTQQVAMELIYQELQKRFKADEELNFSVELMNDIIDDISELNTTQKTSLKFKFRPLEYSHFFVEKYQRNIVSLIKKGFKPAINVENFENFGKGAFLFPEVTLSIILREVVQARRKGEIKSLWIFLDEASRFIGNRKSGSLKEQVLQSVDLDTKYGINYCLEENTIILTNNGRKKIKDLDSQNDMVVSWNFKNKKNEFKKFKKFDTGVKKVTKIICGKKDFLATKDHKMYVWDGDNIIEKKVSELKVGDELVQYSGREGAFNSNFGMRWNEEQREHQSNLEKNRRKLNPEKYIMRDIKFSKSRLGIKQSKEHIEKRIRKKGWKHSDVTIKKLSIIQKEIQNKKSDEDKKKYGRIMSKINKGRKFTKEHKDKISQKNKGKIISDITKEKLRKAHKGKKLTKEHKLKVGLSSKKHWKEYSQEKKDEIFRKVLESSEKSPNKLEKYCINILDKFGFEFYGDGKKGNINGIYPDFFNKNKKIIIEVYAEYWKNRFWGSIDNYKKIRSKQLNGFKVLFFNQKEVYNSNFVKEVERLC